jgi:hypothetical protein
MSRSRLHAVRLWRVVKRSNACGGAAAHRRACAPLGEAHSADLGALKEQQGRRFLMKAIRVSEQTYINMYMCLVAV